MVGRMEKLPGAFQCSHLFASMLSRVLLGLVRFAEAPCSYLTLRVGRRVRRVSTVSSMPCSQFILRVGQRRVRRASPLFRKFRATEEIRVLLGRLLAVFYRFLTYPADFPLQAAITPRFFPRKSFPPFFVFRPIKQRWSMPLIKRGTEFHSLKPGVASQDILNDVEKLLFLLPTFPLVWFPSASVRSLCWNCSSSSDFLVPHCFDCRSQRPQENPSGPLE
jgi:hypothetical protein